MFHRFTLATSAILLLCACQPSMSMEDRFKASESATKMLDGVDGPEVSGIEATLLESAQQAERGGKYTSAIQFYAQLLDKNPDKKMYRLNFADALRKAGSYPAALAQYKLIKDDPEYKVQALEGMALTQMAQGEYEVAGDMFSEVMELDASRWRTINGIAILFSVRQMYPEARQYFAEALVVSPNNVSVLNNQGLMEALDKQYDEAIRVFKSAQNIASNDSDDREQVDMNLALIYAVKGDLESASSTAGKHLNEQQLLNNMGYYAHISDDDKMAKTYLSMALTKSPNHYNKAWKNLDSLNKLAKRNEGDDAKMADPKSNSRKR